MPVRQIRKNSLPGSKSRSRKNYTQKIMQKGGDTGRFVLPQAYFGNGAKGYYADGSSSLNSCGKQSAVSQGVIASNGKWAGPNLYPMMGGRGRKNIHPKPTHKAKFNSKSKSNPNMKGGACGCNGRRNVNKPKPTHKSKSRKH